MYNILYSEQKIYIYMRFYHTEQAQQKLCIIVQTHEWTILQANNYIYNKYYNIVYIYIYNFIIYTALVEGGILYIRARG